MILIQHHLTVRILDFYIRYFTLGLDVERLLDELTSSGPVLCFCSSTRERNKKKGKLNVTEYCFFFMFLTALYDNIYVDDYDMMLALCAKS